MLGGVWVEAVELAGRYGHVALVAVVLLEAALAVRAVPTEVAVPALTGALAGTPVEHAELVGLLTATAVVGSAVGYGVFRTGERGAFPTDSGWVRPPRSRVDGAREWLSEWGPTVCCWGRLLPRVRGSLSAAAGAERVGVVRFLWYSVVGWCAYLVALVWLVYPGEDGSAPVDPVVDATVESVRFLVELWPAVTANPLGWGLTFAGSGGLVVVAWALHGTLRGAA